MILDCAWDYVLVVAVFSVMKPTLEAIFNSIYLNMENSTPNIVDISVGEYVNRFVSFLIITNSYFITKWPWKLCEVRVLNTYIFSKVCNEVSSHFSICRS